MTRPRRPFNARTSWSEVVELTRGRCIGLRSSRDEDIGDTLQDRFTFLIAQVNLVAKDAPIGFGLGFAFFQNGQIEIELIARAYRVRQPQLIPTQPSKDMEAWSELGRQQMKIENVLALHAVTPQRSNAPQPLEMRLSRLMRSSNWKDSNVSESSPSSRGSCGKWAKIRQG